MICSSSIYYIIILIILCNTTCKLWRKIFVINPKLNNIYRHKHFTQYYKINGNWDIKFFGTIKSYPGSVNKQEIYCKYVK